MLIYCCKPLRFKLTEPQWLLYDGAGKALEGVCRPVATEAQDRCVSQKRKILNGTWRTFHVKLPQSIWRVFRGINWTSRSANFSTLNVEQVFFFFFRCCANRRLGESSKERRRNAWGSYPLTSERCAGSCISLNFTLLLLLEGKSSVKSTVKYVGPRTAEAVVIAVLCCFNVTHCHYSWWLFCCW